VDIQLLEVSWVLSIELVVFLTDEGDKNIFTLFLCDVSGILLSDTELLIDNSMEKFRMLLIEDSWARMQANISV
jgi:hypothetical protein